MCAAERGKAAFVRLLLAKGASVNLKANSGATALSDAGRTGHSDVEAMLIQAGATR